MTDNKAAFKTYLDTAHTLQGKTLNEPVKRIYLKSLESLPIFNWDKIVDIDDDFTDQLKKACTHWNKFFTGHLAKSPSHPIKIKINSTSPSEDLGMLIIEKQALLNKGVELYKQVEEYNSCYEQLVINKEQLEKENIELTVQINKLKESDEAMKFNVVKLEAQLMEAEQLIAEGKVVSHKNTSLIEEVKSLKYNNYLLSSTWWPTFKIMAVFCIILTAVCQWQTTEVVSFIEQTFPINRFAFQQLHPKVMSY